MISSSVPTRSRVLLTAYSCDPTQAAAPGDGWAAATAAARDSDVWVITRRCFQPGIEAALLASPETAERVTVMYLDVPHLGFHLRHNPESIRRDYLRWQRKVSRIVDEINSERWFAVAHHVPFENHSPVDGVQPVPTFIPALKVGKNRAVA